MSQPTSVPRPDSVTAMYLVAVGGDAPGPGDVDGIVVRSGPVAAAPVPPAAMLAATGADADALARLAAATTAVTFAAVSALDAVHPGERRVRGAAVAYADAHDGLVVDLAVPRLGAPLGTEAALPAVGWCALERVDGGTRTHGLGRFGLPDLVLPALGEGREAMGDAVVVGLAQRVIEEWPVNDPVGPATVTVADIGRGYGHVVAVDDPTAARGVDLTLAYLADDDLLEIALHGDPAALFGA